MNHFEQQENIKPNQEVASHLSESVYGKSSNNALNQEIFRQSDTATNHLPSLSISGLDNQSESMTREDMTKLQETNIAAEDFAIKNFNNLDSDKDGFVSKNELTNFSRQNELTGQDRKSVNTLKDNIDQWQKRENDEWGFENNGLSMNDLVQPKIGKELTGLADNHFAEIDTNGDGELKADEIRQYSKLNESGNPATKLALEKLTAIAEISQRPWNLFASSMDKDAVKGLGNYFTTMSEGE